MFQIVGTQKIHPFAAVNMSTNAQATTLTNPVCSYRINGGSVVTPYAFTISAYNSTMKTFSITVPAALATVAYNSIEISIVASEGEAHLLIDVVPDPTLVATAASITTAQTGISAIQAKTDNLPGSVWTASNRTLSTSPPTAAQIVAAFDADVIEGSVTRIQLDKINAAVLLGAFTITGNTITFKGLDGTTSRLVVTTSASGRSINSRDGS
jgi:hypothetical protein